MALPRSLAAVYPETGETRILELHFTYSRATRCAACRQR